VRDMDVLKIVNIKHPVRIQTISKVNVEILPMVIQLPNERMMLCILLPIWTLHVKLLKLEYSPSDVLAWLGLKAVALAWLSTALASRIFRPGQSRR